MEIKPISFNRDTDENEAYWKVMSCDKCDGDHHCKKLPYCFLYLSNFPMNANGIESVSCFRIFERFFSEIALLFDGSKFICQG